MTLEDFFTLTEMKGKGGLATLARVEELVSVMQKQKDNVINNAGDAARQWSTVASVLVATENKNCLTHFIHLEGLWFLNQWLEKAQKHSDGTDDSSVEESINALLVALEKLPIDYEQSISTGLEATVKHLHAHKSLKVQEMARLLCDSWNQARNSDKNSQDAEKGGICVDEDPKTVNEKVSGEDDISASPSKASAVEVSHVVTAGTEVQHSNAARGSDASQLESKDVKDPSPDQAMPLPSSNQADVNSISGDGSSVGSTLLSNTSQESLSLTEEASKCPAKEEKTFTGAQGAPNLSNSNVDDRSSDVTELKGGHNKNEEREIEMNVNEGSPCTLSKNENGAVSSTSVLKETVSSSACPANVQKPMTESSLSCDVVDKETDSCPALMVSSQFGSESGILETQSKSVTVDCGMPKCLSDESELKPATEASDTYAKVSPDGSRKEYTLRKEESPESSFHRKEPRGRITNIRRLGRRSESKRRQDFVIQSETVNLEMGSKDMGQRDKRRSEMPIDYGVDDALEVARLVAKEVEREVVDYREPFCSSSSDKMSEGESTQPSSPDSVENKPDECMMEQCDTTELPREQDSPYVGSSSKVMRSSTLDSVDNEPNGGMQDAKSSQAAVAQGSAGNVEKAICDFDLNEDVHIDEMESPVPTVNQPVTLSAPIPVIASSKGAPGLPATPLHFEGELGWKGTARTSAFRPASPRRTPDGEKSYLAEASSHSSKQKQNFLKIDLNVAEGEDDAAIDLVSAKHAPVSSGLPSGESSIEVNSKRADRLKLDLNSLGDNEDSCLFPLVDQRVQGRFHQPQNSIHGPSPASSSSSRHPSMINIDLNDNPFENCGSHDQLSNFDKSSSQDKNSHDSFKLDDPVVSIMGSRMDINRKEIVNRTQTFLANGQSVDPVMSANLVRVGGVSGARPALGYPPGPPTAYGYNGLTIGPTMSLPPQLYGHSSVPYMVDSRGATVIPQILGSSANVPPSFSRPPFLMSVTGAPSGINSVGASRSGFDLNSGMAPVEGDNREMGNLRQLFVQGHGGFMDEQMKSALQPGSTGMPLKRKEPECGWELNMLGYKQETSWH